MDERYMSFSEITFEAYIKSAIERSVLKARLKKAKRGKSEHTFSMLSFIPLPRRAQQQSEQKWIAGYLKSAVYISLSMAMSWDKLYPFFYQKTKRSS